ncbi:MAG: PAS domain-containing protein [Phenylobacterium sp.]
MVSELGATAQAEGAQEALYAYWAGLGMQGRLPARADLRPSEMKSFLPMLSLTDVRTDDRFSFRLAGTGLYRVFGTEVTGRSLGEVYVGSAAEYWRRELSGIVFDRRPAIGVHSLGWRGAAHLSVLWMRLPLASNGKDVDMILGYDALLGGDRAANRFSGIRAA